MTEWLAPAAFLLGLLIVTVAAIGSRTMVDFSHRKLEVYSRAKRRREMFERILDSHDEVALAVEKLEGLGLILLIASGTVLWERWLQSTAPWVMCLWLVAGTLLLFAVTSWIPRAVARQCSAPFLLRTWWFWRRVHVIFWPLRWGPCLMDAVVRRLSGNPERSGKDEEEDAFEDEIMTMVTVGERDGLLESDARDMIEGVFDLPDTDVIEIMTPRSRVDAIDIRMSWPEILDIVVRSGRTRLPVYENSLDTLVGVLYVKDLLPDLARQAHEPERTLREMLRPAWLIPGTMPLLDLLRHFRSNRRHLAIVVDEYQTVLGVVTIEDVLEEIVGEIVDESDKDEDDGIRMLSETAHEVVGNIPIYLLNERLGLDLPESDDYDTLAGLVVSHLGFIPRRGEVAEFGSTRITVLDAQPRVVERLLVETTGKAWEASDASSPDSVS
ncbi:MAG: hemolysin family protein [Pirellulaceae bacterium]|nr:hemolysin family protein [Pirellulaceae bacterium]